MQIAIATDHNGSIIKNEIKRYLTNKGYQVIDCSPSSHPTDDYSDYAIKTSEVVASGKANVGILICGTGIGMSIVANKVKGIRCAHITNVNDAILAREVNYANMIAIGAKININENLKMIDVFLNTEFGKEERYIRNANKIIKYENGEYIPVNQD